MTTEAVLERMVEDYIYTERPEENKYYVDMVHNVQPYYQQLEKYIKYIYDSLPTDQQETFKKWAFKQYNGCTDIAFSNTFTRNAYRSACTLWRKLFSTLYINYAVSPTA